MLAVYLCGALITAVAALGASVGFSDPRTAVPPLTRGVVAVLAGTLWPVVAVGALSLAVAVPLLKLLGTTPESEFNAQLPTEELMLLRPMAAA